MYDLGCMLVKLRPFVVLDGLPGLYGLKYDSATACGLLLYLCSYKLDGSATPVLEDKGVGEVLPSPVEVQVTTIGEHLHLPPGHALLIV